MAVSGATSARSKVGILHLGGKYGRVHIHYAGKRTDETTSCPGQRQSRFELGCCVSELGAGAG